ncbi:MAG: hypothetical protein ABI860_02025 [Gemmatimonadales bacterium]
MLRINAFRRVRWARATLAICGGLVLSACGSHYTQNPARLSLRPYGRVALVTFTADQGTSELSTMATQRFADALLASQSGVELLELSSADTLLRRVAAAGDASALAQALGREKQVPAVFLGHLNVSGVKPRGLVSAAGSMSVKASVAADLTVRLLSTSTGGTLWRSSSTASGTVGRLAVAGQVPSVAVRDPDEAYGQMVRDMVRDVTRDLPPTWVKQ